MSKRYTAIVKIKNRPDGSAHCVKYRFDNLLSFTKFLDKDWAEWKWLNVYSNKDIDKGSGYATKAILAVPIMGYGDRVLGVMQLINKLDGVGKFNEEDESVLGYVMGHISAYLELMLQGK